MLWIALGWLAGAGTWSAIIGATRSHQGKRAAADALDSIHEIRRPLTALMLGLELLSRDGTDQELSSGSRSETAHALKGEVGRISCAADRLVGLSATRRELGGVDIDDLVREVACGWGSVAAAAGRRIIVSSNIEGSGVLVSGDRDELGQAASNLVTNALEHGEGEVQLVIREERGAVQLSVLNLTPVLGLDRAEQSASAIRMRPWGGRGVRIAGDLVRANGGWISSRPGRVHEARIGLSSFESAR